MAKKKFSKNSVPIRADGEIFMPELEKFKIRKDLVNNMPNITREIGKEMKRMRIEFEEENRDIMF